MNFIQDIEIELDYMSKYNLTHEELFVARLIMLAQEPDCQVGYLNEYIRLTGNDSLNKNMIKSLQLKQVIKKTFNPDKDEFDVDLIEFNSNFLKFHIKHSCILGQELFNAYPDFIMVNGVSLSAKSIQSKSNFQNWRDVFMYYAKCINNKVEVHNKILDLIQYGKDAKLINSSFSKFVSEQGWMALNAMKQKNIGYNESSEVIR